MSQWVYTYLSDYRRVIFGVIADSRANIPQILNQPGVILKSYVDSVLAQVTPGVLVYGVYSVNGSLAAYIGLQTIGGAPSVIFSQMRPAFVQFQQEILSEFHTFIVSTGNFQFDGLQ